MTRDYVPSEIEAEVQARWRAGDAFRAREDAPKPKFYGVSMLPYPSGKLHMGHVRNYALNDAMCRFLRMNGHETLMPMGWDAFGLPAENAALAKGLAPAAWTYANIAHMKGQMQGLGFAIDWSREITTCRPDYYRWSQLLFLRMLKAGVVYKKTASVNWDPIDKTVLANEQVIDGRGWRSGALVERRDVPTYYLAITRYAEELLSDLEGLGWPERVKLMQRNWIGRSEGVQIAFPYEIDGVSKSLKVFTTRADTLMGVTFVAVAADHPLALHLAERDPRLAAFAEECRRGGTAEADLAKTEKKGGVTGFHVRHPLTGAPVEIWIANYVVMGYGEGAVMGVPAHDARDFAFAKRHGLAIRQAVRAPGAAWSEDAWDDGYAEPGVLVCGGPYDGLSSAAAVEKIASDLEAKGLGHRQTAWRLRDWGVSRQRYWGTPIPMIHCPSCGDVPVPESDLPVVLPEDLVPDGSGNPLASCEAFLACLCPQCGGAARRESDTMDTFIDSSWYFMRYCCPDAQAPVDQRVEHWMPMDQYVGGIEHAILHLLYARFWTKVMRDLGFVSFSEPARNLMTQGMVLNDTFYREDAEGRKSWFNPDEVEVSRDERGRPLGATLKSDGAPVRLGGVEKMAKSKNNGVDPEMLVRRYGADTTRLFVLFSAPPEQQLEWSGAGVEGASRFLRRVFHLGRALPSVPDAADGGGARELRFQVHDALRQADADYRRMRYNTVVSAAMKLANALEAAKGRVPAVILQEGFGILLRILAPITPHLADVLWRDLGYEARLGDLLDAPWPEVDAAALQRAEIELALQIDGKTRGALLVPTDASREAIEAAAVGHEAALRHGAGRALKRVVVVPGRLVNLVFQRAA